MARAKKKHGLTHLHNQYVLMQHVGGRRGGGTKQLFLVKDRKQTAVSAVEPHAQTQKKRHSGETNAAEQRPSPPLYEASVPAVPRFECHTEIAEILQMFA